MLLTDEQYVVKWLSQYGALPRAQIIKMLQKPPQTAEKILQNLLKLLQPQEDMKYIVAVPRIDMVSTVRLPNAPCLFATVDFCGQDEPEVRFYSEEATEHEG